MASKIHGHSPYRRLTTANLLQAISKYEPQDATTNPSLILAASKKEQYAKLQDIAVEYGKQHVSISRTRLHSASAQSNSLYIQGKDLDEQVDATLDRLLVEFGKEILQIIPGKVSTEVDARFSFDTKASIEKALHIIEVHLQSLSAALLYANVHSCTKPSVSVKNEFSSKLPRHGRVSKQPTFCSQSTESTAT